jgi:AcrR family transcriptional regulator
MRRRLTREESREQTRKQLLDAAAEVFGQRGFYAASVDEVAETAGYSKGAVYSNFEGKDDLFLALLDRQLAEVGPQWDHAFDRDRSLEERVDFVSQLVAHGTERECAWTMLEMEFFLFAMRDERARTKLAAHYRRLRRAMQTTLERHFADTGITPLLPVEALTWLSSSFELGLQIQMCLDPDAVPGNLWPTVLPRLLGNPPPD